MGELNSEKNIIIQELLYEFLYYQQTSNNVIFFAFLSVGATDRYLEVKALHRILLALKYLRTKSRPVYNFANWVKMLL